MEHHENLSRRWRNRYGRSQDPDSADSQWYIAETSSRTRPRKSDDEGYVTFGIVRNGMSHVRAIATVPTSNDRRRRGRSKPSVSAGRPIYEVHISNVEMIEVIPYPVVEEIPEENETVEVEPQSFITTTAGK